jgi:hypothetical protein
MTDKGVQIVKGFPHHRRIPLNAESLEFNFCVWL